MKLRLLLFLFLTSYSTHAIVVPACIKILGQRLTGDNWSVEDLAKREKEIIRTMQNDPAKLFIEIRREAKKDFKDGQFSYPIFEATLRLILNDMQTRVKEDLHTEDKELLKKLIEKGEALLRKDIPYKDSMRFTFDYTQALDKMFLRLHPELGGRFHRKHAEHVLEKALARGPDLLLLPSYQSVGFSFFNASRSAPLHVIGLHPSGLRPGEDVPFADGYDMMPSEFAWHDMGHIEFMAEKDFEYVDHTFKPIERVVQEWDYTKKRIKQFQVTQKANKNLFDATTLLLFEILHERGYQYSFSVLKAQLDTPKWTEILMRKLDRGYYKRFSWVNMNLFPELENARRELLKFVTDSRIKDQKNHITALYGSDLPVRVTHFPKVGYGKGRIDGIEIDENTTKLRSITDKGELQLPHVENLILAQISPTKKNAFNETETKRINALLNMKKEKKNVTIDSQPKSIQKIYVSPTKTISVIFSDNTVKPLSSIEIPETYLSKPEILLDRHFFELNQVLGAKEVHMPLSYTLHQPTTVHLGTATPKIVGGKEVLEITTDTETLTIPIDEALVDPLQKTDFERLHSR